MQSDLIIKRCPIELAMSMINRKWVILLIRDMFFGKSHFNEFKEDKPNLSNKVLSNCLKDMEKNGLIERKVMEEDSEIIYQLTSKGLALNRVLYELACFALSTDLDNKYYDEDMKVEIQKMFGDTLKIN